MMTLAIFLALAALTGYANAKEFSKCEANSCLIGAGVDKADIPQIICAMRKQSDLDSSKVSDDKHGIFGLSEHTHCKGEDENSNNLCDMSCADLTDDDANDDCTCFARTVWRTNKLRDWDHWVECGSDDEDVSDC